MTPALLAILLSIPVSIWWFASLSLVTPLPGPSLIPLSHQVLTTTIGLQAACVALFAPLWVTGSHNVTEQRSDTIGSVVDIISFLFPAFPLLVMLGLATGVAIISIAMSQLVVLALGTAVAFVARIAGARVADPETQRILITGIGVIGAACFWTAHAIGLQWVLS